MNPKTEKLINTILVIVLIGVVAFVGWFLYEVGDMIKDHQCSTTTDIEWYVDNNCMKYYKNPWE